MRRSASLLIVISAFLAGTPATAQEAAAAGPGTAEALVRGLYDAVTFEAGSTPDWDHVRSMFLDGATVVLRSTRTATTVFDVDGFVADFVAFIDRANVRQTGFTERVVRTRTVSFGDIAHALVLYEAGIPESGRPPQQGVDSFQLIRKDGRWWIVSIVNEIPGPDRPLPPELRGGQDRTDATERRLPRGTA